MSQHRYQCAPASNTDQHRISSIQCVCPLAKNDVLKQDENTEQCSTRDSESSNLHIRFYLSFI